MADVQTERIFGVSPMTFLRGVVCIAGLATTLVAASGCSGDTPADRSEKSSGGARSTTIELTVDDQPVDLANATPKCYDYQGHLVLEAYNAADREDTYFLLDFYRDEVTLGIGIRNGQRDHYQYEEGKAGQSATVERDGDSVSVTGTIAATDDSGTPPTPFSIEADCAKFFDTPPDSSKVG
jgi:Mycobacterium 19 kDa lipoprotein antigen